MKKKKRGKKAGTIAILVLLLALILLIGYNVLQVKHVKVAGAEQYTADAIIKLAAIPEGTQMLRVDEKQMKENIESDPGLLLKFVDYELPDTVVLTIEERLPAALVSTGTSYLLLDKHMVLLKDNDTEDEGKYPEITGISIKTAELGKQVSTDDTAKIPALAAILDELDNQDDTGMVTQINLADINNILFKTQGGPDVLFGQPGGEAAKINWMVKLLPGLISEGKTDGLLDVSAGTFATYGANHMPAPTQSASAPPSGTQGASAPPSQGASASAPASPSGGVSGMTSLE